MTEKIVYQIKNTDNGKQYIGSTIEREKRWRSHRNALQRDEHFNLYLQRSWNKYGEDVFKFLILERVNDKSNLRKREQFYLDTLEPEYNIAKDTEAFMRGREHTEETKRKIGKALRDRELSEATRQKISEALKGREFTEEAKQKMSENTRDMSGKNNPMYGIHLSGKNSHMYGKHHTEETKRKIGRAKRGQHHTEEAKQKMSENTRDMSGEKNSQAKLTKKEVKIIRYLCEGKCNFTYKKIGNMFGVALQTIGDISNGRKWKHIKI